MFEGQSRRGRWFAMALLLLCASACLAVAQVTYRASTGSTPKLSVAVTDENGVAVPSAHVSLQSSPISIPLRCETDFAGHCQFENLTGDYQLRVQKEGFYAVLFTLPKVPVGQSLNFDVTLSHQRE